MSGTDSIFHANGVCDDSPGCNPGTAQSRIFRPTGANGSREVGISTPTAFTVTARGATSGISRFVKFRPNAADGSRVVGISTPTAFTVTARGATPGTSRFVKFRPTGADRSNVVGISTPTAFTVTARGATPENSRFVKFRPNGADGSQVSRHVPEQPFIPSAPLGRGTRATGYSRVSTLARVSPFAITAYPFGDEKCGAIGDIKVFGQDKWAWGAHLRRAQRARRVRLRRKQLNQCVTDTARLARLNLAVHGLSGDIKQGNTYYEDLQDSVGRFDQARAKISNSNPAQNGRIR